MIVNNIHFYSYKWLFAHIGSNTRLLTVSQASDAINIQCNILNLHGLSSNQWTVYVSETWQEPCYFVALSAKRDMHDTHDAHDTQHIRFTNKLNQTKSIGLAPGSRRQHPWASNLKIFAQQNMSQTKCTASTMAPGSCPTKQSTGSALERKSSRILFMLTSPRYLDQPRNSATFVTSNRACLLKSRTCRLLGPSNRTQVGN